MLESETSVDSRHRSALNSDVIMGRVPVRREPGANGSGIGVLPTSMDAWYALNLPSPRSVPKYRFKLAMMQVI
jgi:hypothetical protein